MTENAPTLDVLVRISVIHAERRIDLAIPGQLALVEVLPGIARGLGVLDPTLLHGGYRLTRADGTELRPDLGALVQGIDQGEVLTLTRGALVAAPKRYDDIVEAVVDSASNHHGSWNADDAARTSVAVSLTLLGLSAITLALQGPSNPVTAIVAGAGAVILLALAATLSRLRKHDAGIAFGMSAAAFGGLCGYLLSPVGLFWGWPLAATSLGLIVVSGVALLVCKRPVEMLSLPLVLGIALGIPATVIGLTGISPIGPYALTVALCGMLAGALPWLTFTSTRIRAVSPQTELEMFDPPPHIDPDRIAARAQAGHRLLVSFRVAFAVAVLVAVPVVASASWLGVILCVLTGATLMFQSRQSAARASVLVLLSGGTVIIAITTLIAIASHADRAPILVVTLLIATALVTGLTLLSDRVRLSLATLADTIEVIVLAALLPIGVITAGLA